MTLVGTVRQDVPITNEPQEAPVDIMSKLPSLTETDEVEGPTEEELRDERIRFHREKVRNGPVTTTAPTSGQLRRFQTRLARGMQKKGRRKQIANHFAVRSLAAVVRGHLQAAGVIPFALETTEIDRFRQVVSTVWLVHRFGTELEVDGVKTGHMSFSKDDVLTALRTALELYSKSTGQDLSLPAPYEVAVYWEEA